MLSGGGGRKVDRSYFGTQIIRDMVRQGRDHDGGRIFDVERDQCHIARMLRETPDTLRVKGCVPGGIICGGQVRQREK